MKGRKRCNRFKNAAISVLLAIVVMRCFTFPDRAAMWCIGYVVVQAVWAALITYDEILRQREAGMTGTSRARYARGRRRAA